MSMISKRPSQLSAFLPRQSASNYTSMGASSLQQPAGPRVLILLDIGAAWSRGILRGFIAAAHERCWTVLHYHPPADLNWLAREFAPDAVVIGPELAGESLAPLAPASILSVTLDRSAEGIASLCPDEDAVAALALGHLLATGLRQVSTFRFDESPFGIQRERAFIERAHAAGVKVASGWGNDQARLTGMREDPAAIMAWLSDLPKPCGVFTGSDAWGRVVARYSRVAGLRIPEDLSLVGADNDTLECELIAPPLSSVIIPWQELGRRAAKLVQCALSGRSIAGQRVLIEPLAVMARRSSDVLAIEDPLVAKAVRWIREHADRRLTVPAVAHAVGGGRQRLERRFRRALDRTVLEEIRRAHVEAARGLLESTHAKMTEVAKRSGFTNAALLSTAFQRELGMPPGLYRRRVQQSLGTGSHE
jgi:LacI family transcriptional regulator